MFSKAKTLFIQIKKNLILKFEKYIYLICNINI